MRCFYLFDLKCASGHNGVLFFHIRTSKNGPSMWCLSTLTSSKSGLSMRCNCRCDFEICSPPQQRTLFQHHNFQGCSKPGVPCAFGLGNVLRETMACIFWFVPDMQLLISHPAKWLRTRCFSEPTFRPSGATNHWKNRVNRNFATFLHTCIFFLLTISLL